jgi:MazG family protein
MSRNDTGALTRIFELITTLRGENGCPWDRVQTLDDILSDLVEEAYELEWASAHHSGAELIDEMGDVLFLLCFAIAVKQDTSTGFDIDRIAAHAYDKIKSRHPHVFDGERADTPEESIVHWERIKADERSTKNIGGRFDGIAGNFPPVRLAEKVQERAAAVGFDWDDPSGILAKLREEIDELELSIKNKVRDEIQEELGDVLFSVINMTRFLKIDASGALKRSSSKFIRRFDSMEEKIRTDGKHLKEMSLEEMDVYWERAKNE